MFKAGHESWDASCVFVRSRAESSAQAKGHLLKEVWGQKPSNPGSGSPKNGGVFFGQKKCAWCFVVFVLAAFRMRFFGWPKKKLGELKMLL